MDLSTGQLVLATILKILFILLVVVGAFAPILIWAERRQSAMMQDRLGPTRANLRLFGKDIRLAGLLHPLADAVKFIFKEDFVPPKADRFLHSMAPIIALVPAVGAFAVIPFADTMFWDHLGDVLPRTGPVSGPQIAMQVAPIDIGILFLFAITSTGVIGAAVAGYASDNKFSLLGGVRAASQMVSYEVALGLTIVPCFMIYGSLRLEDMGAWQASHQTWGIFSLPMTLAFILFFTASIAESKRIPFDLPEGESELVGGYLTEYSGMKFGMFFMSEFVEVVGLAALATVLFFGAWDVPFLFRDGFDLPGSWGFTIPGTAILIGDRLPVVHWGVLLIQVIAFLIKIIVLIWLQLMIRWTLPRFRYDQVMILCWKGMLPLALFNILFTGVVVLSPGALAAMKFLGIVVLIACGYALSRVDRPLPLPTPASDLEGAKVPT